MEDNLNILGNWSMTSTFWVNGKQPQLFRKTYNNLNILGKQTMTSFFSIQVPVAKS